MPAISKIRLTNVVYEEGNKRYNDELFLFDGHNGGILLENGGGKTVLIQTALQAVLPHVDLADRKIKNTLLLENAPAHIAIEWIDHDQPRRYVVTAVTLFLTKHGLDSLRYVYEYNAGDPNGIEGIPFVREGKEGKRPAERGEMQDYYSGMKDKSSIFARTFDTIKEYRAFIEKQYHIITSEWESIVKINSTEGGVEAFFDDCKSTNQLFDRLLIPTVEDSIVGHDKDMFADMFERQHQSFKNYKKLKETIEENKRIQDKLENYVKTYENLHHKEQDYLKVKQQAKGVWNLTFSQKKQMNEELLETSRMRAEWEAKHKKHQVKEASYEIAIEKDKLDKKEAAYNLSLSNKSDKEEEQDRLQKNFYSLKLAKFKLEWKEEQNKLTQANEQLTVLEKDEEVIDLQETLGKAEQSLLGSYLEEMEKINSEKQGLTYHLNPILEQVEHLTNSRATLGETKVEIEKQLAGYQATIHARMKDMEKIKQQILSNPQQEQVHFELEKWQERSNSLDQESVLLEQKVKELIGQIQEEEEYRDALLTEQSELEKNKNEVTFQLNELHEAQKKVIIRLSDLRPQWASIEEIYATQQTIETRIIEQMEKLKRERNELLFKERLAYRFADDYGKQDVFFSDPFLEKQLASWKNQLDYVVTGVEYLQNLEDEERNKKKDYPLWPLALVTTNKSRQHLKDKLNHIADRLQYPITVLTTEEALRVEEIEEHNWIAPHHWSRNLDTDQFMAWKKQIKELAQEKTRYRELKENELTNWEDGWKILLQFLGTYTYEAYERLHTELTELTKQVDHVAHQIKGKKSKIADMRLEVDSCRATIKSHTSEMQGLHVKIDGGLRYQSYEREVDEEQRKVDGASAKWQQIEMDLAKKEKELQRYNQEKEELQKRINDLDMILGSIKREDDFVRVESLVPIYSGESKQSLKNKIREINRKIDHITVTQGEWIAKQEAAKIAMDRLHAQMEEIRNQQSDLDENLIFPSDGQQLIETLQRKIQDINEELTLIRQEFQRTNSEKDIQIGKYEKIIEEFEKDFIDQDLMTFDQPLVEVAEILLKENDQLIERKTFIDQQDSQINRQLNSIIETEHELDRYIESHHFNAPDVKEIPLSDEQKLDFTYQRKKYVKAIIEDMKLAKQEVDQETEKVEDAKVHIRDFCRNEISDVKLQKMAINGVEHKRTFEDVVTFKNNMLTSIERISKYAHEHIRKSDEDLQLFINQIHTHLKNIVDELKQIPNKTKVKVHDDWKQIFSFSIPEWEEEIGKTRIRDHIEWILKQLESERLINEQGQQEETKVRKDIEMWLQTKSLLQIVMNNEVMKVSCRKVTNDNKVTSKSFSWEQSNVWSGGEKWSKNMTLFLGILNYVAEKKQHLQTKMKRNRAVILDNPFGKASSDHVLSPVFFVAEQLGFQIIALTAHAEGKFLQDYFPIIYSCRLRSSKDSSKKVMTKEKWLHHAYFQDHEPQGLERLGEVEQMELF